MRLTVIGATGGIGRSLVTQAVEAGHDVTAVVRDPAGLEADVRFVPVDMSEPDPAALSSAVAGADAVLSALGPRRRAERGIVSRGTAALVAAMSATGTRRVLIVTGVGISTVRTPNRPRPPRREPGAGFVMRHFATPLSRMVIGSHMADVAAAEEILACSGLEWTAVRPPYLTDGPLIGDYQVAFGRSLGRAFRLSRADAAHCMLRVIGDPRAVGRTVTVAY